MPDKKNLRIGVTINLENYENLRVEVEGDVSGDSSADELINYLDTVLEKFGNSDPDTKNKVDSYRRRVIGEEQKKPLKTDQSGEKAEREIYPDKVSESQKGTVHYNEDNKIIKKATLCEICGSAVTPQAEHASRVIAGRVLCRKCLDSIKK